MIRTARRHPANLRPKPERLSMKVLIALCDILDCTPAGLAAPQRDSTRNLAGPGPGTHPFQPRRSASAMRHAVLGGADWSAYAARRYARTWSDETSQ
jgi:Cro/C1-type HTH DNA-binding domain